MSRYAIASTLEVFQLRPSAEVVLEQSEQENQIRTLLGQWKTLLEPSLVDPLAITTIRY